MFVAVTKIGCQDLLCVQVCNELRLLGMTLLFAAVMPFLSFLGRSIGCSVASTNTISITYRWIAAFSCLVSEIALI
jgi:hypothetical protein